MNALDSRTNCYTVDKKVIKFIWYLYFLMNLKKKNFIVYCKNLVFPTHFINLKL